MNVIELFAGAGGMALGLKHAGFEHSLLVEFDKRCCETLKRNGFKHVKCANVNAVDFSPYRGATLVAGGVPCQPFSNAGVGAGNLDPRNGWPAAVRAVREIKPRTFLFENVAGLLREKFKNYLDSILKQFWDLGYSVHVFKVDAADYGVPQHRKRVFIVGLRGVHWFGVPKCAPGMNRSHRTPHFAAVHCNCVLNTAFHAHSTIPATLLTLCAFVVFCASITSGQHARRDSIFMERISSAHGRARAFKCEPRGSLWSTLGAFLGSSPRACLTL